MFLRRLVVVFLILVGCAKANCGVPLGFLEGHLRIISPRVAEREDANVPKVGVETYAQYPLIVLSRDGKREITRVVADAKGNYRLELPPGDYVLDVQGRASKRVRAAPRPFTVISNRGVRVDMDLNTGLR